QIQKAVALEFATEQSTQPRPRKAKRKIGGVGGKKKTVPEYMANGVRFNVATLGRQTVSSALIPVREQIALRRILHGPPDPVHLPRRGAWTLTKCPGPGHLAQASATARSYEQAACRTCSQGSNRREQRRVSVTGRLTLAEKAGSVRVLFSSRNWP